MNQSNRCRTVVTDLLNQIPNTSNPLWVLMPNCLLPFAVALFENNYISSRTPAPCNSCFISFPSFLFFSLVGRRDDELLLKVPMAPLPWAGPNGAFVLFVSSRHLFFPVHRFPTPYHHIPPPQTPTGLCLSERRSVEREKRGRWMRSKAGIQLCPAFWCMLYLCLLINSICLISIFFWSFYFFACWDRIMSSTYMRYAIRPKVYEHLTVTRLYIVPPYGWSSGGLTVPGYWWEGQGLKL